MNNKVIVNINELKKSFDNAVVFEGLNLEIEANEIVAILGPSGCGKSTLLRCIVGLEKFDRGELLFAPWLSSPIRGMFLSHLSTS